MHLSIQDYYAGFAIENVVPAYIAIVQDEFDLAVAGLVALVIVLFVGVISFIVLCCCLKHWNLSVPVETRRKEALIKKQIIEDLNTTENPLWIEQYVLLKFNHVFCIYLDVIFSQKTQAIRGAGAHHAGLFGARSHIQLGCPWALGSSQFAGAGASWPVGGQHVCHNSATQQSKSPSRRLWQQWRWWFYIHA